MFEYIKGKLVELNPSFAIVEAGSIGYFIQISLNTYSPLVGTSDCKLYLHHVVREDAELLFGFFDYKERDVFRALISVSGIGPNTARMMLSSIGPDEIREAILAGNLHVLTSIKGVGAKTAQRLVVELKDKIGKSQAGIEKILFADNTVKEEALSALVMLGFSKSQAEKVIDKLLSENRSLKVEELIKRALKML
jgi:holliday junction DNA helicase RuvA